MRTIIFNDIIEMESIYLLIENIENNIDEPDYLISSGLNEDLNSQKIDGQVRYRTIYFSSDGGDWNAAKILLDYINNNTTYDFFIIFNNNVGSAGFELLLRLQCPKKILNTTFSIVHLATTDIDLRQSCKKESIQKKLLVKINNLIEDQISKYREIGISEKIIKKLKLGEDVILLYDEILNLKIDNLEGEDCIIDLEGGENDFKY